MSRFFSFGSSSTLGSDRESPAPSHPNDENLYQETHGERAAENALGSSHLRRSLLLLSPVVYGNGIEGRCSSNSGFSRTLSDSSNVPHQVDEGSIHHLSLTPGRLSKLKRHNEATVHKIHAFEEPDSPRSSRGCHGSPGNSPDSSPVSLRCRSSRITQVSNTKDILNLYIDGEQQESRSKNDSASHAAIDGCLAETRPVPSSGWPPRALSTAPVTPISIAECPRSHLLVEEKDICHHRRTCTLTGNDLKHLSPKKYARKIIEWQSCAVPGKAKVKLPDDDSQSTTTIEDVSDKSSRRTVQRCSSSDHIPTDDTLYGCCIKEALTSNEQSHLPQDTFLDIRHKSSVCLGQSEDVDGELLRKLEAAEDQAVLPLGTDIDSSKLESGSLRPSELVQVIQDMLAERKNLLSELSSQIHGRISERSSSRKALKQAKVDLDTRMRRLEKARDELKSNLERELDRRSTDWSLKLERFQAEEQRLRQRVRELAEQNVSLQREVSSLSGREMEAQCRVMDSETRLNELTMFLEEMRNDNVRLQHDFSELKWQINIVKGDQGTVTRICKDKEKEAKELQKAVSKLQRICSEQEKTIIGLRQGYADQIGKQSQDGVDLVSKLQAEHVRLTGVEQSLRREVESYRWELESLKCENLYIMGRLRCAGTSCAQSFFKLDQELHAQIDCLRNQALSLLDNGTELCSKLLGVVNSKQCEFGHVAVHEFDGLLVLECEAKLQSLNTAVKKLRRSLQTMVTTLDERSNLESLEHEAQDANGDLPGKYEGGAREGENREIELELKAETLLARALREKLCYKELELEQLQAELASSVRGSELLKYEIQRLKDDLACVAHNMKSMELQMLRKDEKSNELQHDLQECKKELIISRDMLPRVSEERDRLWEEIKQSRESNMLLDYEVKSLKKKIEALEEDILVKDGQITILKDSLGKEPFDILYSTNAIALE